MTAEDAARAAAPATATGRYRWVVVALLFTAMVVNYVDRQALGLLKAGQLVTTGAASGIHDIEAGQTARITFAGLDEIHCVAVAAVPGEGPGGQDDDHDNRTG